MQLKNLNEQAIDPYSGGNDVRSKDEDIILDSKLIGQLLLLRA